MRKERMGYGGILCGLLFLVSPDISLFDILPDFIGYLIIISALSKLADIDERAEDARNLAKRLFVLSIIKFVCSLYLAKIQKTNLLLVTFSFAVLDLILVIPFARQLFYSIDYTAARQGVMLSQKKNFETKSLLMFLFVLKDTLMTAPAAVSLFDPSETGEYNDGTWFIDFSALTNVLTVLSFFLMCVMFVFAAVRLMLYFLPLMKNRELISHLYDNYRKTVLLIPARMITKNVRTASALIMSSFVFFADFYIDFIDVFPTALGFSLVFAYSVFAKVKMRLNTYILSAVSLIGVFSAALSFCHRLMWYKKHGSAIEYNFSKSMYTVAFGVSTALLCVLTMIFLWKSVAEMQCEYLGGGNDKIRTVVLSLASTVVSLFGLIIYVFPEKNVTFVFPNLLFAAFFVYISVDRYKSAADGILAKYKTYDF